MRGGIHGACVHAYNMHTGTPIFFSRLRRVAHTEEGSLPIVHYRRTRPAGGTASPTPHHLDRVLWRCEKPRRRALTRSSMSLMRARRASAGGRSVPMVVASGGQVQARGRAIRQCNAPPSPPRVNVIARVAADARFPVTLVGAAALPPCVCVCARAATARAARQLGRPALVPHGGARRYVRIF